MSGDAPSGRGLLTEPADEIRPAELEAFLARRGWMRRAVRDGVASLWASEAAGQVGNVLVPQEPEFRDYPALVEEAIQRVADGLGETTEAIRSSVLALGSDVVRIRCVADTGRDGSISFDAGMELVNATRKALMASAAATERARAYFGRSKSQRAKSIGERVRLGQTERGSYVMTLLVRNPRLQDEDDEPQQRLSHEPAYSFERRSLTTLARALHVTNEAVDFYKANGSLRPFLDGVADGISSDLCDALIAMESLDEVHGVGVEFRWAETLPPAKSVPSEIHISGDAVPALKAARERLHPSTEFAVYELTGTVDGLRRREGDEEGVATVSAIVEGSRRSVRVPLSGAYYKDAIHAHEEESIVTFRGELTSEGSLLYLLNADLMRFTPRL